MTEGIVRPFDRHDRIPVLITVAFVERVDCQRAPVVDTESENGDCLVDSAQPAFMLAGELHEHIGRSLVLAHDLPRPNEVGVGEKTLLDLFDGKIERRRVETFSSARCHYRPVIASGSSTRSSCSRVSRPRSRTTSYTPRPVSNASLATDVAWSYPITGTSAVTTPIECSTKYRIRDGFAVIPRTHRSRKTTQPFF